jgi:hypothetical protein
MRLIKAVFADMARNRRALSDRVTVSSQPDALTVARNQWAADLAERRSLARLAAQARFDESLPRFYTGGPSL